MNNPQILDLNAPELSVTAADSAVEMLQLSEAWRDLALQLGYICLAIGFVIGLLAGYYYCKGKYGSGE